jgi:hypothetical protein
MLDLARANPAAENPVDEMTANAIGAVYRDRIPAVTAVELVQAAAGDDSPGASSSGGSEPVSAPETVAAEALVPWTTRVTATPEARSSRAWVTALSSSGRLVASLNPGSP